MKIYHIVAVDKNKAIGKDQTIPWKVRGDLKRFKELTMGHPVIMGRKTFESLGSYGPLPGRKNIVLTSKKKLKSSPIAAANLHNTSLHQASSLEEAYKLCRGSEVVYIIGGEQVYRDTMERASMLRITHVDIEVDGADAFYPELDLVKWRVAHIIPHEDGTHMYIDYIRA